MAAASASMGTFAWRMGVLLVVMAGCGQEECSVAFEGASCPKGTVKVCCTMQSCKYTASDQTEFLCNATDCAESAEPDKPSAVAQAVAWCSS